MKILVLGGTGAIGTPLVEQLSSLKQTEVFVTSRSPRKSFKNVTFIKGDAHDDAFLAKLLDINYDAIIDFMVYRFEQLERKLPKFLKNTKQYFFFSSSRVYANSIDPIKETSALLLDVCRDLEYLSTKEYALEKAREENLLFNSGVCNWTIIRPYITYNNERLQLGVYEKENWLLRALHGRTVIFPRDIAKKNTSLTYGPDVAKAVIRLIGNERALGEAFHIATSEQTTWQHVLEIYKQVIEEKTGIKIKVVQPESSKELQRIWHSSAQIKYDRLFNRSFDSTKIIDTIGELSFLNIKDGIEKCLVEFLEKPKWRGINCKYEAWADKYSNELTPLKDISGIKAKIRYLKYRYFVKNF